MFATTGRPGTARLAAVVAAALVVAALAAAVAGFAVLGGGESPTSHALTGSLPDAPTTAGASPVDLVIEAVGRMLRQLQRAAATVAAITRVG